MGIIINTPHSQRFAVHDRLHLFAFRRVLQVMAFRRILHCIVNFEQVRMGLDVGAHSLVFADVNHLLVAPDGVPSGCLCEFPEAREGRLAGNPFPPAGPAAAGEVCRLYEVHPADLSVDGRRACRKVPGKVPGTETDYITIQTLLEYASNDI